MSGTNQVAAEKTYRAIGRFIFEFSQAEYTIRHYLAQEIGLDEEHFSAVVESYDVAISVRLPRKCSTSRVRIRTPPVSKTS
jgi:hypothetical protein